MRMIRTEKTSGYFASIPGAFIDMYCSKNVSMCLPISSSNVALHALATLDVPVMKQKTEGVKISSMGPGYQGKTEVI